jgi:Uma2 family endonuclease
MQVHTLVAVDEYLHNTYEPDCDYVDGELVDRNVGEKDHSKIQKRLIVLLSMQEQRLGINAFPEQRVQVSPSRFRVPDVWVIDPRSRRTFVYGQSGVSEVTDTLETEEPAIRVRLQDVLQ